MSTYDCDCGRFLRTRDELNEEWERREAAQAAERLQRERNEQVVRDQVKTADLLDALENARTDFRRTIRFLRIGIGVGISNAVAIVITVVILSYLSTQGVDLGQIGAINVLFSVGGIVGLGIALWAGDDIRPDRTKLRKAEREYRNHQIKIAHQEY